MISRDWSNTGSSSWPHCGRARATIPKASPAQRSSRRRDAGRRRARLPGEADARQPRLGPQDLRVLGASEAPAAHELPDEEPGGQGEKPEQVGPREAHLWRKSHAPAPNIASPGNGEPGEELRRQEVALRLELDLLAGVDRLERRLDRAGVGRPEEAAPRGLGDVPERVLVQVGRDPAVADLLPGVVKDRIRHEAVLSRADRVDRDSPGLGELRGLHGGDERPCCSPRPSGGR